MQNNLFLQPLLSPQNDKAIYIKNNALYLLEEPFKEANLLATNFQDVKNLRWSKDGQTIAYIQNQKLKLLNVQSGTLFKIFSNDVESFEWGEQDTLYVTQTSERELCVLQIRTDEVVTCLKNAKVAAVMSSKKMCVFIRDKHLYLYDLQKETVDQITSDAGDYQNITVSFDENYISFSGGVNGSSSLYVFDIGLHLLQNLTEMLDLYVGDALNPTYSEMYQTKQIQWTETNALYFLVSTMGDVRLYYADLDGSIFPASPEEEHVYDFSVSNSGNWAIIANSNPTIESQLSHFDITMGAVRLIEQQTGLKINHVEKFYEVIQIESNLYNTWTLFPEGSKEIIVICNKQNEMLGNTYYEDIYEYLQSNKAVIYMNIPGAAGYDEIYRNQNISIENKKTSIKKVVKTLCRQLGIDVNTVIYQLY